MLANQLTITDDLGATLVTGAQSVAALNSSITTTQPTATGNDADVSGVVPTQALLDQAKAAITVANRLTVGGSNPDLTNLLGIINTLTAGGTLTAGQITQITTLLPAVTTALDGADNAATSASGDDTALSAINGPLLWGAGNWNQAIWE